MIIALCFYNCFNLDITQLIIIPCFVFDHSILHVHLIEVTVILLLKV